MPNKQKNSKATKSKSNKSNKGKSSTPKRTYTSRARKVIQGGGGNNYYASNSFDNTPITQNGGEHTSGLGSNLLLIVIVVLLAVISYLLYMNYVAKQDKVAKQMDIDINNTLLQEANNIKKQKRRLAANNARNNINRKAEQFHDIDEEDPHQQYNLAHRLVGSDANNPQSGSMFVPVLNHAIERIINPLLPPERSYVNTYGIPTNIPSRGFSGGYQQVGSLHKTSVSDTSTEPGNNNKSVILPLFGQPTYPGSNKWNYYTTTDKNAMVKMTFKVGNKDSDDRHGVNEIMTGDKVQIPEYNGDFDVKVYQFDQPRYIPFVY